MLANVCIILVPCGIFILQHNLESLHQYLSLGFVPVLHGDCVLDHTKGCTVLSGDTVILETVKHIPEISRVVFLTDVDGVYDRSPIKDGEPKANGPPPQLLHQIWVDSQGEISTDVNMEDSATDVTGGMKLKLATAARIALESKGRVPVIVCRLGKESSVNACITGLIGENDGTIIKYDPDGP